MKWLHKIAFTLLLIGGLNWLLWGLFGWEIGSLLGGMDGLLAKVVYVLVGLSAVYEVATHAGRCKGCMSGEQM